MFKFDHNLDIVLHVIECRIYANYAILRKCVVTLHWRMAHSACVAAAAAYANCSNVRDKHLLYAYAEHAHIDT